MFFPQNYEKKAKILFPNKAILMDSENSLISFQLILFNEKKEKTYYPYFKKVTYIYKTYNVYAVIVYFCSLL